MKKYVVFSGILLFVVFTTFSQQISTINVNYNLRAGYWFKVIGHDNANVYFYEYPEAGMSDVAKTNISLIRMDLKTNGYERFSITSNEETILSIEGGSVDGDIIYVLYYAKVKASLKYALVLAEYKQNQRDISLLSSKVLTAVKKEEELANIKFKYSPNHHYLAVMNNQTVMLFDKGYQQVYVKTLPSATLHEFNLLNDGTFVLNGVTENKLTLYKVSATGDVADVALDYKPQVDCDIVTRINGDEIHVGKLTGRTSATLHDLMANYENRTDVEAIEVTTYSLADLAKKSTYSARFNEKILEAVGLNKKIIKWLAFDNIIVNDGNIIAVTQKHYNKFLEIDGTKQEKYLISEDFVFVSFSKDNTNKQYTFEKHCMAKEGDFEQIVSPRLVVENKKVYLFYYETKTGVGTYKNDIYWGEINSDMTYTNKGNILVQGGGMNIDFTKIIKTEKGDMVLGHYLTRKLGSAIIKWE